MRLSGSPSCPLHPQLCLSLAALCLLVALQLADGFVPFATFKFRSASLFRASGNTAMTSQSQDPLLQVLAQNKRDFTAALKSSSTLQGWIIAMGNEAGDLDSIASATGFAYLASQLGDSRKYIPLYQADRADLQVRPENALAFDQSHISPTEHLFFLDDLPEDLTSLYTRGVRYALVDHNRLSPRFSTSEDAVVAVIDHHEDEGLYRNVEPRLIQVPTGSTSSLVTVWFHGQGVTQIPRSLADLLIAANLIDTNNVKPAPKGKAVAQDIQAIEILAPQSSFATAALVKTPDGGESSDPLKSFHAKLAAKKFDLSGLPSRDLLRRDYKEFVSDVKHYRYGLSTVPVGLQEWMDRAEIGDDWNTLVEKLDAWGQERQLDIAGILTSYVHVKKNGDTKKGRELVFLIRGDEARVKALQGVFSHLEQDTTLIVGPLKHVKAAPTSGKWAGRLFAYQQGNQDATRKQVAPAMKSAIASVESA